MDTIADYNAWKSKQQLNGVGAAVTVLDTINVSADETASDLTLAAEFGKTTGNPTPPLPMVQEYRNVFQAAIEREKTKTILSDRPRLTDWLRNPENAAVARDDLAGLSWFEGFGRGVVGTGQRALHRLDQVGNQYMFEQTAGRSQDRKKTFGELVDDQKLEMYDMDGNRIDTGAGPIEYLGAFARWADARFADLIGTDDEAAAQTYATGIANAKSALAAVPKSMIAREFEAAAMKDGATAGEALKNFGMAFLTNPHGGISWALETAGESAPQLGAAIATTLATRSPMAGATVGGVGSYATERYTAPADFFAEQGIDISTPEGVQEILSSPDLMRLAAERGQIRGLIIGAFDLASMGIASKALAGNPFVEGLAQAATQMLLGSGGEATARIAAGQDLDWNEIIAEGFAELATTPVDMGIAGRQFNRQRRDAKDAEDRRAVFEELSASSQNSALRNRLPDRFRQFVEEATKNGPVENVFVPAGEFVEYFQGLGVDPYALIEDLDGVSRDDLDVALAGGGDLQIPTATYAAKIAGSEHDAFLMENMRFDPNEMTAREAAEFNERAQDALDEAWQVAENERLEAERFRSFEQEIYDTMVSRLRAAGRSTDVATTEAMLYPAFYRTMAERSGMTVDEFMAAYPLPQVEGARPEGMQSRDVDALTRTLAEARVRRSAGLDTAKTPLLEFISEYGGINDPGGELRARDAEVIKRGRGKKTLKLSRRGMLTGMRDIFTGSDGKRYGMDDVAQAAIEAGFMADNPVVMEYNAAIAEGREVPNISAALLEEIDRELRGDTAMVEADPLDEIEEYLSKLGVSLDDDDATIRAALEAGEADGRQYGQVSPEQARLIDMPVEMPADPLFSEAVSNTPGASITDDGLLIDLVRYQKPEQEGSTSVRTGVFYLPTGSASAKFYKGKGSVGGAYGGPVEVRGQTLVKRPLFVKGATGGKAPEAAYDAIKGKKAYFGMRLKVIEATSGSHSIFRVPTNERDERLRELLIEYGADGDLIYDIVANSTQGNQLAYALQENIVAHAVREAGYDAVVGYSKGKAGAFISEVFDVREVDYPTPGETATLHPDFAGRTLFQRAMPVGVTDTPAFKRWFGDSKVVDDQGKPLVVYHGTSAEIGEQFSFDPSRIGSTGSAEGYGFYFTTDVNTADGYRGRGGGSLAEVYLSMQKPMPVGQKGFSVSQIGKIIDLMVDAEISQGDTDSYKDTFISNYVDTYRSSRAAAVREVARILADSNDSAIDQIAELGNSSGDKVAAHNAVRAVMGFDGIASDGYGGRGEAGGTIYVAWFAEQIKSVNNRGTFDPSDPRLLFQDAPTVAADRALFDQMMRELRASSERDPDATKAAFAQMKKLGQSRDAWAEVLAKQDSPVELGNASGSAVIVTRSQQDPNGWRVTYYGDDGFSGHTEFKDKLSAVRDAMSQGYDADASGSLRKSTTSGHFFQDMSGTPRGSVQFPAGGVGKGDTVISLFQGADLSTMLHESGHYFLTVMQDLAARGEASAAADFGSIKDWWRENAADVARDGKRVTGVDLTGDDVLAALDGGSTGDAAKDAAIDVGMQEQFARGFEAYLMEGKAPNAELRSAFEKFRAWLISIYRKLTGLNVTISDEVRRVMDRMIATDEEIAKAQADAGGASPVFATAEEMGLTPDEYAAFLKLRDQSEDEAKSRLLRETMAPIKRERDKWFKDERAKVREETARSVNAYRQYRAIEWMGNRRWLGEGQPVDMPDIRLSKDILVDRYGAGILKTLPRGKQTVYAVEGGIDPDDAAGWFGFGSGDEMVRAMETAPHRVEAIDAETDREMRERHGDVLTDGNVEAAALDAIHTDKRGQWIAAELKAVAEVAGVDLPLTAKQAREAARQTTARMKVRDAMNAQRFLAAERKSGQEAARLGAILAREGVWMQNARRRVATKARAALREDGTVAAVPTQIERANASTGNYNETVAKLIDAKRRQLVNHALYMEARKVADEVEKAERFVASLSKKSKRERIAGAGRREGATIDYLAAIDELLERYDFRRMSGSAEDRRGALTAYVEAMKAAGRENELSIPETVLMAASRAPYKTIPVEELRGVVDSLKNLEHVALRWDDLIDRESQRKLDEVADDIVAAFDANVKKRPPGRVGSRGEAMRNAGRKFLDLVLNAGTILREIDGFADMGAAYRNIKGPIDGAMNLLMVRRKKAAEDIDGLYSVYSKEERRRMAVREHVPSLGYALSKWEKIAVALNTGNEGNRQRLTDPKVRGSFTDDQVDAVLATLDARDAAFVQSVWDYIGTFRDDIAARERRTTGVEPQWVEASPVTIAGKTLKGGYYPIKYDPRLSSLARDDAANDIATSLQAGRFGKAQTRNGHLKDRAKSSGRDVELDMSVFHRHIQQVIYDIELSEPVANSWRIIQDKRVRAAFTDAGKSADFDALEIWLKDVAEGEVRSGEIIGRGARMLKSNFTAAKLAFNLSTVAVQLTGVAQSMVVVGKKNFLTGVMQMSRPGAVADITAKSSFMADRQTTFNKDIYDFYNDPKMGPVASRWGDIKTNILGPLSFIMMTKVQYYSVDVPTWLAGYQQSLNLNGNDEAKAIAHADAIVKRSQASGIFSDRSAIERGSVDSKARQNDVVRLFTALGSYMFAKFNVAYERSMVAGRTVRDEGVSMKSAQEALSWTIDMAFLFTLEAVLYAAIKGRLPDEDDDEDDWSTFLVKETAMSIFSTIPIVRDVSSAASGFEGGGAYGAITKELSAPFIQALQGEVDKAFVKSIVNATGLATGLPSTQINRAVDTAWRQAEGEDVSVAEYLLGKRGK